MKVLFAVNNDNVSDAIIKKYQKTYKEIISYKNVYYFNAILKELQNDKSYDRVVISEDLEPFANNNYDTIDKFLFEKLDKISDEATKANGEDINVILICTDRRNKSDEMLTRIFGIGIYNALIGEERNIDNLCKLLNQPRTKKEAKIAYKISGTNISYQVEDENNVSEAEVQNILAHYKRLGKDEEKYVDSFNNIVSQYTDSQLRIIIRYLPLNVKAVLEEQSPKYQELTNSSLSNGGRVSKTPYKPRTAPTPKKEEKIKIKMLQNQKDDISKPIVIPSALNNKKTIIAKPKEIENTKLTKVVPTLAEEAEEALTDVQDKVQDVIQDEIQDEIVQEVKRGRGRPRKYPKTVEENDKPKRGRGRPKKVIEDVIEEKDDDEENDDEEFDLFNIDNEDNDINDTNDVNNINDNEIDLNAQEPEDIDEDIDENINEEEDIDLFSIDELNDESNSDEDEEIEELEEQEEQKEENDNIYEELDEEDEDAEKDEELEQEDGEEDNEDDEVNLFDFDEEDIEQEENDEFVVEDTNNLDDIDDIDDTDYTDDIGDTDDIDDEDEEDDEGFLFDDLEDEEQEEEYHSIDNEEPNYLIEPEENEESEENENVQKTIINTKQPVNNGGLSSVLTKDKKIVIFVGTTKNGTSFIVNNLALTLASMNISTAILDMTQSRNAYYIFTKNEQSLRDIAEESITNLSNGISRGIEVNRNLTVYTELPGKEIDSANAQNVLATIMEKHDIVLIDADFKTDVEYFEQSHEIYLVQSMDILTIQPLTAFLRNLKSKDILKQDKLKIIINKWEKVKSLSDKILVGGISSYNDPAMSYMTELFDKEKILYCKIPFETQNYVKYLDSLVNCDVTLKGYTKQLTSALNQLASMVYPLLNKNAYTSNNNKKSKMEFSDSTQNTLNKMKKNY